MPKNNTVQNPKPEDDKSKDVDPKPVKSEPIKDPGPIDNPTWSK
jgi:hypothetical protein